LYPNATAAAAINQRPETNVRYELQSVSATDVPPELDGVRTMIRSFHHMPPPVAKAILADAFHKRQPFFAIELSDNSPPIALWWMAIPMGIILPFFLTPFIRPLTWRQIVFTYVIPILPLLIAWDGSVSNARTYTENDLAE
jgi:hypothetical protein